jgi:hypothetical protein
MLLQPVYFVYSLMLLGLNVWLWLRPRRGSPSSYVYPRPARVRGPYPSGRREEPGVGKGKTSQRGVPATTTRANAGRSSFRTTEEGIPIMDPMPISARIIESSDGGERGELDQPYAFERLPSVMAPCPFAPREFARLLVLRGRVHDGLFGLHSSFG